MRVRAKTGAQASDDWVSRARATFTSATEVHMNDFGLRKRCGCPKRSWTKGCPHTWHYAFKWKRRRHRGALDDVLGRHISGKTEALKEVEKIFDAVDSCACVSRPMTTS